MINYSEALNRIHSLERFGSRPGLDRVNRLFSLVGDDLLDQNFIHVAGTNGKGSVSAMISSILTVEGYKTGLFISPYITDFRERIQINGEMVSEDELVKACEHLFPLLEKLEHEGVIITEFEFLTVLAFYIYKKNGCEYIVCEVGMGGLLDSTNLIRNPVCSVITRIDYDHTDVLGKTLEEITVQKCGIIKENSITVTSSQQHDVLEIIRETAHQKNNMLFYASDVKIEDIVYSTDNTSFIYKDIPMNLNLLGKYQIENLKTALSVIDVIKIKNIKVDIKSTKTGLEKAKNPGRFELFKKDPLIILDGAHNPGGISAFCENVRLYSKNSRILIMGMLKDKDIDSSIKHLEGLFDTVITVDVKNPRSIKKEELREKFLKYFDDVICFDDPSEALNFAKESKKDVFVCGSLYLISEIRKLLV